jgi:recombinational DNA repair protein RecT
VKHEGKETIEIVRKEFVKGFRGNDWVSVFDEFAAKIGDHIGKEKVSTLSADFSTSGTLFLL